MAITFDGANRIIQLDGAATVSIRGIYSRWVDWAATSDNLKWLPAFSTVGQPPTVPVYVTLLNGWLVRPLAGAYRLTLNDGFLYVDGGGEPITAVSSGTEPRVRYENPVIAVGYESGGGSPLDPAAVADAMLARSLAGGADGGRTVRDALRASRNRVVISGSTLTVYAEDDATVAWTATITTAQRDALQGVDPA
jgi:hypothetical protein